MQVEHKTEKGTVLFYLPEQDSYGYWLNIQMSTLHFTIEETGSTDFDDIPNGDWQVIGLTSEVTEEQCDIMLPGVSTAQLDGVYYSIGDGERYCHENALSAFKYLMQNLQVHEVNPLQKPNDDAQDGKYLKRLGEWQEKELHSGRWIVLFKPNEK